MRRRKLWRSASKGMVPLLLGLGAISRVHSDSVVSRARPKICRCKRNVTRMLHSLQTLIDASNFPCGNDCFFRSIDAVWASEVDTQRCMSTSLNCTGPCDSWSYVMTDNIELSDKVIEDFLLFSAADDREAFVTLSLRLTRVKLNVTFYLQSWNCPLFTPPS